MNKYQASLGAPESKHTDDIVAQPDTQLFKFGRRPGSLVRARVNLLGPMCTSKFGALRLLGSWRRSAP